MATCGPDAAHMNPPPVGVTTVSAAAPTACVCASVCVQSVVTPGNARVTGYGGYFHHKCSPGSASGCRPKHLHYFDLLMDNPAGMQRQGAVCGRRFCTGRQTLEGTEGTSPYCQLGNNKCVGNIPAFQSPPSRNCSLFGVTASIPGADSDLTAVELCAKECAQTPRCRAFVTVNHPNNVYDCALDSCGGLGLVVNANAQAAPLRGGTPMIQIRVACELGLCLPANPQPPQRRVFLTERDHVAKSVANNGCV